jgi:hypothetical protein
MSVEQDIFVIGVSGSRKNIIRMLNAAIRNVAGNDPIVENDNIEVINLKLGYFTGHEGHDIGIFDLFDDECLKDKAVIKKKESSDAEAPYRYIEIVRVEEGEVDYTAKFSWYLYETYEPSDWAGWEDIARLYDCRVFVDDDYYRNGEFIRFESATIYEPGGEMHRFESGETRAEYDAFMDKLAELYPERYRPIRERYLKAGEEEMAYQREMKRLAEKYELPESINDEAWARFTSSEAKGIDAVKEVYASCLEKTMKRTEALNIDGLQQILVVRAEELKGVNDELAHCYVDLLRGFRNDYDNKVKELQAKSPQSTIFIEIEPKVWEEYYGWLECYPYEKYEPDAQ